ncbi:UDP-N,N'-diacetylbacillosamine 2-epimerase (hydrolyzing) [compost metagenome]
MTKVVVVTGTRADYGIYYPILKAIEQEHDLELHLLVTGMHLKSQFGNTIEHIKKDGFHISAVVDNLLEGTTHANMARSIGNAIIGMTQAFEDILPNCAVVLGDRGEMLAAAIVSSHMNIPLVHLHGGEVSGTVDESVRHAISKLSHIHLVATEGSKERLIRLGEDSWRIHVVGAPRIETIMNTTLPIFEVTKRKYSLDFTAEYILFAYHPVTNEKQDLDSLKGILETLISTGLNIICVMPNSDAGADNIVKLYQQFSNTTGFYMVTSFEQLDYLAILKQAKILVGNSSSGIIEAASFRVPVINIGTRQWRRERSANVVDISENENELSRALEHVLSEEFQQTLSIAGNVYEKKNTSASIVNILKTICNSEELIQKTITY